MVALIVLARVLGLREYAEYTLIYSTVAVYGGLLGLGIGVMATRYLAEARTKEPGKVVAFVRASFFQGTMLALLVCALMLCYQAKLNFIIFEGRATLKAFLIFEFGFLLSVLLNISMSVLWGFEAHRMVAIVNLVLGVVVVPLNWICLKMLGSTGAYLALALINVLPLAACYFAIIRAVLPFRGQAIPEFGIWEAIKEMLQFSVPSILGTVATGFAGWFVSVRLMAVANGVQQVAFFQVGAHWRGIALFFPNIVALAALPLITAAHAKQDNKSIYFIIVFNLIGNGVLVGLLVFGVSQFWGLVYRPYGPNFYYAKVTVVWLLASAAFQAMAGVIGQMLVAQNRMWIGLLVNSIFAAALFIFGFKPMFTSAEILARFFFYLYVFHFILLSIIVISLSRWNRAPLLEIGLQDGG